MADTNLPAQLRAAKAKVLGGIGLAIVAFGLWIMVFFQILFSFIDSVSWLPLAGNIVVDVLAVAVTALAIWMLRSGARSMVALQDAVEIEGLASVVGDLPHSPEPTEASVVTDALLRLNELDLPYTVQSERDGDVSTVTVQWRSEELRWRTLLTRGTQVMRWRMVLRLDDSDGRYTFSEHTAWSRLVGSGATASISGAKGWSRGKSMGAGSVSRVWAVGQVDSPDGTGSSGSIRLVPSDAKVPVFRIVRAHGWRPKRDSSVWRLWEY